MQVELYQALSRQDEVLTFAGSPMLTGEGMPPPQAAPGAAAQNTKITVGPKSVLFAPPSNGGQPSRWSFIQPDAANIKEIRAHVQSIVDDMRRLGMQPLTQRTGTPTATGQSIEAAKAHSSVQAWALGLQDVLEQAFVYTAEWLNEKPNVEVIVSTDFSVLPFSQPPLDALDKARARRDVSLTTYWDGLRRFDVLPPDFDPVLEKSKITEELKTIGASTERDPATGHKIDVDTNDPAA